MSARWHRVHTWYNTHKRIPTIQRYSSFNSTDLLNYLIINHIDNEKNLLLFIFSPVADSVVAYASWTVVGGRLHLRRHGSRCIADRQPCSSAWCDTHPGSIWSS